MLRGILAATALAVLLGISWTALRASVGEPSRELARDWHIGHDIRDRNGARLYFSPSHHGLRGKPLPLRQLGERIATAAVHAEDQRFWSHGGVDTLAVARALVQNLRARRVVSGASTITVQLVELLDTQGNPGRTTLASKLVEAARAQNLETKLSKSEILAAYLNRLPFGHGLVGVEAAAQAYFGTAAHELSWAQATYLVIIPRAPTAFDPYRFPDKIRLRQHALLKRMAASGTITAAQCARAMAATVDVLAPTHIFEAPHAALALAKQAATQGKAQLASTLDLELQHEVEAAVARRRSALRQRGAHNVAVVVMNNDNGAVLAYIGNHAWSSQHGGQIDMANRRRQAGSMLKPFAYALGFEHGLTPSTMLADVATAFPDKAGTYAPQNIDHRFLGPLAAAEALTLSRNVPAVAVTQQIGDAMLLKLLGDMGLHGFDREAEHYGPALVLGAGPVSLIELVGAYSCLARGGECVRPRLRADATVETWRVLSPGSAAVVNEALSNPAWKVRFLQVGQAPIAFGFPAATKTGTSSGYVDTWTAAYTRQHTAVAWVGNADGRPTSGLTGSSAAGAIVHDALKLAWARYGGDHSSVWDPEQLRSIGVCPLSGQLPSTICPHVVTRRFAKDHPPHDTCSIHRPQRLGDDSQKTGTPPHSTP